MGSEKKLSRPARLNPGSAWMVLFSLVCLVGVLLTYGDYGITWDEAAQARYGELVVDYFLSGFQDESCNEYLDLKNYGALFEAGAAAVYRLSGTHPYETRHLLIGLTAVLTLVGLMLLGRLWRDPWVAALAGPLLLLLPRFYGHAFNNSKDLPFACGFTWSMYAIARLTLAETLRWRDVIVTGAVIGLTLSLRVGGVLLLFFLGAGLALRMLARHGLPRISVVGPTAGRFLAVVAVAWAVMVAGWPWAHGGPFSHPLAALSLSTDFTAFKVIRFAGEVVTSQDVPRSYLPWYLSITTPLATLALALVGLVFTLRSQWRDRGDGESLLGVLVQLWLLFPLAYVVVARPVIYDGIRHFLFVLPGLALLAAIGAARLRRLVVDVARRQAATLALIVVVCLPLYDLVVLHPYQSSYFNSLVGKVRGAAGDYDVDYWVSSYKEASEWINARAVERGRPLRVLLAGNDRCLPCYREYQYDSVLVRLIYTPGFTGALPDYADYYVSMTRRGMDENFPDAPIVHTIGRAGAVFTVIKGREGIGGPAPGN